MSEPPDVVGVGAGAVMTEFRWTEAGQARSARWRSESGSAPTAQGIVAGDTLTADAACRLAREGHGLLWRGDFQNARKLLQAMARRVDRRPQGDPPRTSAEAFQQHRRAQALRARTLGMLLLPFDADHRVPLRRAPDVRQACLEAHGVAAEPYVASLRELQGLIGAHEWRKKGVEVPALGARIHPHYGVFTPIRAEYAGLAAKAPLPSRESAFDVGTGTGVLAAILGRRGVKRIVATDLDPRAVACARENLERLGLGPRVETRLADLFPEGRARLVVCNPPWIPAPPTSPLERAVYDREPHAARVPVRPGRAPGTGGGRLADPVGPCGAPGPAVPRRAAGGHRSGRLESRGPNRRAARPSPCPGCGRPPLLRAREGDHVALAPHAELFVSRANVA